MRALPTALLAAVATLVALASSVHACAPTDASMPACTNEAAVRAYGDAGILPPRALPGGYPCATGDVCYATIDNCPGDWPDAASAPFGAGGATPFECDCVEAFWACEPETQSPPVCASQAAAVDAGGAD